MDLSDPGETKTDGQLWQDISLGVTSWSWALDGPRAPRRVGTKALAWVCRMVVEVMI